ncbi:TetR/AcrR family transcriptional regulator [Natronorubrum halophilum]|uniref:TetR/AcrR family transcriptional regulator n=1 Tax=Natronorubrum halophilum TaxID=1702106 RepID=UPI001EE8912D|nr:TetR/AcrR family transcriptional regulator [Natronorubrum halophilum]
MTTTETTDELMEATYAALCKHGYASLRMQDIADESSKSKATLHYHYESKQDLLYALLDHLTDSFADRIETLEGETPAAQLLSLVEQYLSPGADDSIEEFRTALLEIKAQGPYDDRFREELTEFDRMLHGRIRSLLEAGQADGIFRDEIDPDETAEFIVTVLNGAQMRHVAVDHPPERTYAMLETYVCRQLLTDDTDRSEGTFE